MLNYTRRQSDAMLLKKRSDVAQKAECFHTVLSNSNHNSLKSYRLNKKSSAYFADDVFNIFDNNLIIFNNYKFKQ